MKIFGIHTIPYLLVALIAVAVPISGCKQAQRSVGIQRQKSILLKELFNAIRDGNHQVALDKLERVSELDIEPTFIHHLGRRKSDDIAILKLNGLLESSNTLKAREYIDNQIDTEGPSPRLMISQKFIKQLRQLENYLNSKPYEQVKDAEHAFMDLPNITSLQTHSRVYENLIKGEKAELAKLKREEAERLISELIQEIDVALITGSNLESLIIAQLGTLSPVFDGDDNWLALMSGVTSQHVVEAVEKLISGRKSRELVRDHENTARDLALFRFAQIGRLQAVEFLKNTPPSTHGFSNDISKTGRRSVYNDLSRYISSAEPSSFTGALIDINYRISKGSYLKAFAQLSDMIQLVPGGKYGRVNIRIAREYIRREMLDITPSVHGLLHHLYYIQN